MKVYERQWIFDLVETSNIENSKHICINGINLYLGAVYLIDKYSSSANPQFGLITKLSPTHEIQFNFLKTITFSDQLLSYEVEMTSQVVSISLLQVHYEPGFTYLFNQKHYIVNTFNLIP